MTCCSGWACSRSVANGSWKPLDLTRVVFSDEKFFRWNYQGPAQNSPIWVTGAHGRPARKADLDPDVCINEHSQRNPGTMVGAAMVNGIVFPPCFIEEGRAHQRRLLHSDAGRRVLATLHGAPWHRHVELVVAGRQRSVHTPAGAPRRF